MADSNKNKETIVELTFAVFLTIIIFYIILIFVTQYCWNNTISVITKTTEITAWQSFLIIILFHILFTSHCYIMSDK